MTYSRVHINWDEILSKTIHSTGINDTSYEPATCFHCDEEKIKMADSKKPYFPDQPILYIIL